MHPNAEDGAGDDALGDSVRSSAGKPLVDDDCDGYVDEEAIVKGDLIVTEINNYSSAGGSAEDSRNKKANWFEVYNDSPLSLDLSNWTFATCDYAASGGIGFDEGTPDWSYCDAIEWFSISPETELVLLPEGYAVLCRDDTVFDDPSDCDYSYGGSTAINENPAGVPYQNADAEFRPANGLIGAALSATSPSVNMLIDDVGWYYHSSLDRWPYELNMSMCLSADALSSSANNALVNWGNPRASDVWASDPVDNYGTPGSANLTCE